MSRLKPKDVVHIHANADSFTVATVLKVRGGEVRIQPLIGEPGSVSANVCIHENQVRCDSPPVRLKALAEGVSASPAFQGCYMAGWRARCLGAPRASPYNYVKSGSRWRTYAHLWLRGWDEANDS